MSFIEVEPLSYSDDLFPLSKPVYHLSPGLTPLKTDFFYKDEVYQSHIRNKEQCFDEDITKYIAKTKEFKDREDEFLKVLNSQNGSNFHSFEEFTRDVQEDFAFMNSKKVLAASVCCPNYWDPGKKVGQDFASIHGPVADFQHLNKISHRLIKSMITKGPFRRYAWGLSTDTRLNHHENAPKGISEQDWYGRHFINNGEHKLYMRIERQHMFGAAELEAFLFTIRTYFLDVRDLPKKQLELVRDNVDTMSEQTLVYKGIDRNKAEIIDYLNHLIDKGTQTP